MTYELRPYTETKHLKGSEDAPVICGGEIFHDPHEDLHDPAFIWTCADKTMEETPLEVMDCHQLVTIRECEACEGKGGRLPHGMEIGLKKHPSAMHHIECPDCTNGKVVEIYRGEDTAEIVTKLTKGT
jgi:hypothetical protein